MKASAPGKAYLFGEHAVVYGEPAVPCAISKGVTVDVAITSSSTAGSASGDVTVDGLTMEYSTGLREVLDVPESLIETASAYVECALEKACGAGEASAVSFDVTVESEIPFGAGLGSSAAVVVATIAAAAEEMGTDLTREEIAELAFEVEYSVQDGQASRADTFCSAVGGAVHVEGSECYRLAEPDIEFVVGYDGGASDTGEIVSGVRSRRSEYDCVATTIEAIGDLVRRGETAVERGDLDEVGRLMDVNHELLSAIGVSSHSLDSMAWAARIAGARGAKLTSAGKCGCVVALDGAGDSQSAVSDSPPCEIAFHAGLDPDGVRGGNR